MNETGMIITFAITYECTKGCGYCFQNSERAFGLPRMKLEDFRRALQWLRRANHREIKMTGGEPTQHPQFLRFCELAREYGIRIMLMTNGSYDFSSLPDVGVLSGAFVHLRPAQRDEKALIAIDYLQSAGVPVVISYTITEPGTLREMVELAGYLRKAALRIDLARWDLVRSNEYIPPDDYSLYKEEILDTASFADSTGIPLHLDCPLPLCMFNEEESNLLRSHGLRGTCSPFSLVNPDLSVGCCPYPGLLQSSLLELRPDTLRYRLQNHPALDELRWTQPLRDECATCPLWLNRQCQGGCIRGKQVLPADARYALPFRVPGGK
jgi:organic radical activating enzyme